VFDSGWFKDLPLVVRIYALPKEITNQHHLFRLGFHGISHEYACLEAAKELKKDFDKSTFISLHLGSGSSIALVHRGKPLDTSMGFTPLAGLPMMTRSGDVDPGIILYLLRNHNPPQHLPQSLREGEQESSPLKPVLSEVEGIRGVRGVMNVGHDTSVDWLEYLLNEESGLKGLSGIDDFRKILDEATFKENAKFALEYFIYHIRKYIGSYLAVAPQLPNAVILTGAIGAGDARFRKMLFKDFALAQRIPVTVITPREELAMMRMVKASSKFKAQNHK